jgi:hypothetical protein
MVTVGITIVNAFEAFNKGRKRKKVRGYWYNIGVMALWVLGFTVLIAWSFEYWNIVVTAIIITIASVWGICWFLAEYKPPSSNGH